MKRYIRMMAIVLLLLGVSDRTEAHFTLILPSDDIVTVNEPKVIDLKIGFIHPMKGQYLNMQKPRKFGVRQGSKNTDLLSRLIKRKAKGFNQKEDFTYWRTNYEIKRPGDYIFYLESQPYWEATEQRYLVHYSKVCVNALGLEKGWDEEIGLEMEIIPLTRPYGIWTGNLFRGMVKFKGKALAYAKVEVEYYNQDAEVKVPSSPYLTQVIKTDENGIFSYAMPKAGWWGFSAIKEMNEKESFPGEDKKSVEFAAVYWVRVKDMK